MGAQQEQPGQDSSIKPNELVNIQVGKLEKAERETCKQVAEDEKTTQSTDVDVLLRLKNEACIFFCQPETAK